MAETVQGGSRVGDDERLAAQERATERLGRTVERMAVEIGKVSAVLATVETRLGRMEGKLDHITQPCSFLQDHIRESQAHREAWMADLRESLRVSSSDTRRFIFTLIVWLIGAVVGGILGSRIL